jgi:hypothetical protein
MAKMFFTFGSIFSLILLSALILVKIKKIMKKPEIQEISFIKN